MPSVSTLRPHMRFKASLSDLVVVNDVLLLVVVVLRMDRRLTVLTSVRLISTMCVGSLVRSSSQPGRSGAAIAARASYCRRSTSSQDRVLAAVDTWQPWRRLLAAGPQIPRTRCPTSVLLQPNVPLPQHGREVDVSARGARERRRKVREIRELALLPRPSRPLDPAIQSNGLGAVVQLASQRQRSRLRPVTGGGPSFARTRLAQAPQRSNEQVEQRNG
eukprot:c20483_g1_i4.p1 GENE.c20483_g1_i4~~c20483_g1_i4.p1  ORF type:complete len:218 (-),score=8.75 c20483_g1_i4:58-711(-)